MAAIESPIDKALDVTPQEAAPTQGTLTQDKGDPVMDEAATAARAAELDVFISQFTDAPPMNKKKRKLLLCMPAPKFASYKPSDPTARNSHFAR